MSLSANNIYFFFISYAVAFLVFGCRSIGLKDCCGL